MLQRLGICFVSVAIASGCQPQAAPTVSAAQPDKELAQKIEELRATIDVYKTTTDYLRDKVFELEKRQNRYTTAIFDPRADQAYQRVDTVVGPVLVVLEDIQPFADGSRATLRIGNVTAATLSSCKLQLRWRAKAPSEAEALDAWVEKGEASKESSLTNQFAPGSWTRTRVTLPGVTPQDMDYVEVGIGLNEISLHLT